MSHQPQAEAIEAVTRQVQRECSFARALILTGSAARQEATVLTTAAGTLWLSDLELMVVVPDGEALIQISARLKLLASRIQESLAASGVFVEVDLAPTPEGLFRRLRPTMFTYELRSNGRQLFGEVEYLREIPNFGWDRFPKEEAWGLLSNRMVEWLDFRTAPRRRSLAEQFYALVKQYLDLITSLALLSDHYAGTYQGRAQALGRMDSWLSENIPALPQAPLLEGGRLALDFKRRPDAPEYHWILGQDGGDLEAGLRAAGWIWMLESLPTLQETLWDWELGRLSGVKIRDRADLFRAVRMLHGWRARLTGWGKLTVRRPLRSGGRYFGRLARLYWRGAPRALVYLCARLLLDETDPAVPGMVRRRLPVLYAGAAGDWRDLARQCVRNWDSYVKRSYV